MSRQTIEPLETRIECDIANGFLQVGCIFPGWYTPRLKQVYELCLPPSPVFNALVNVGFIDTDGTNLVHFTFEPSIFCPPKHLADKGIRSVVSYTARKVENDYNN